MTADLSYLLLPDVARDRRTGEPLALILEVDGQLLAALAAPRSHRAALIANTERRAVDALLGTEGAE